MAIKKDNQATYILEDVSTALTKCMMQLGDAQEAVLTNSFSPEKQKQFTYIVERTVSALQAVAFDVGSLQYYLERTINIYVQDSAGNISPATEKQKFFMLQKEYAKKEGKLDAITLS